MFCDTAELGVFKNSYICDSNGR